MLSFIGRRFFQVIPTLLGVVLVTFFLMRLIPGDPTAMIGGQTISDEVRNRLRAEWHLDDPPLMQLYHYVKGLPKGDMGVSMRLNVPVSERIAGAFVNTMYLGLAAFVISVTFGLSLGIMAALTKGTFLDRGVLAISLLFISTPVFVVGIVLIILAVAVKYPYFSGTGGDTLDLRYLLLPAVTLGSRSIAYLARMTRSAILEVGNADFLRTARAKGLSETMVVFKHQMRNAMIPITTVIGLNFADYLTGAILTESIFQWPGIGLEVRKAIEFRDLPVIMGVVLFVTVLFVTINFVVDLLYAWFDPRIRYS